MATPGDQAPEVILVIGEADLVSDLQQQFVPQGLTVRFAETPGDARQICETVRPRLVVSPIDGAPGELLAAWSKTAAPADVVIGLVESLGDAGKAPACVERTARKGQARELVGLAELLLRSHPPGKPAAGPGSIWDQPGGILANAKAKREAAGAPEDEPDLDPGRVSDIRSLAVAVRMAKTMGQDAPAAAPASSASIKLRHGSDTGELGTLTPAEGMRVADALAELPKARAAKSHTERMKVLAEAAPAAPADASPAKKKPAKKKKPAVVLGKIGAQRKSRRGLLIGLLVVLLLGAGGAAAWYRWLRPRPVKRPRPAQPITVTVPGAPAPKHGEHVDLFAGTIARLPQVVTALDVDVRDEQLHLSVPELNPFLEKTLARLSRKKRRAVLLQRGTKLLGFERYPEARGYLYRAVKLKDGPKARAALARAYAGLGRYGAAVTHVKRALKRDKKSAALRAELGQYYLALDQKKKGCRALAQAAKRDAKYAKLEKQHCGRKR